MKRGTSRVTLPLLMSLYAGASACTIGYEAQYLFDMRVERRAAGGTIRIPRVGDLAAADGGLRIGWRVKDFGLRVEVRNEERFEYVFRFTVEGVAGVPVKDVI